MTSTPALKEVGSDRAYALTMISPAKLVSEAPVDVGDARLPRFRGPATVGRWPLDTSTYAMQQTRAARTLALAQIRGYLVLEDLPTEPPASPEGQWLLEQWKAHCEPSPSTESSFVRTTAANGAS